MLFLSVYIYLLICGMNDGGAAGDPEDITLAFLGDGVPWVRMIVKSNQIKKVNNNVKFPLSRSMPAVGDYDVITP